MCDIMGGGRRVLTGLGRVPAYTLATTGSPTRALSPGSHLMANLTIIEVANHDSKLYQIHPASLTYKGGGRRVSGQRCDY